MSLCKDFAPSSRKALAKFKLSSSCEFMLAVFLESTIDVCLGKSTRLYVKSHEFVRAVLEVSHIVCAA